MEEVGLQREMGEVELQWGDCQPPARKQTKLTCLGGRMALATESGEVRPIETWELNSTWKKRSQPWAQSKSPFQFFATFQICFLLVGGSTNLHFSLI